MVSDPHSFRVYSDADVEIEGMILFPLGERIFSDLGPDGLSMFYVSCIVSQLVYSCGGSAFKGGIGSEMVWESPLIFSLPPQSR